MGMDYADFEELLSVSSSVRKLKASVNQFLLLDFDDESQFDDGAFIVDANTLPFPALYVQGESPDDGETYPIIFPASLVPNMPTLVVIKNVSDSAIEVGFVGGFANVTLAANACGIYLMADGYLSFLTAGAL